ncbi:MAG: response regulator [Myxococcota bacterium]|nr:response regulator [Deltaproteobacteria bacterium]MDQ3333627.1 response regulator [Myxococcota bacterium]
MEKLALRVMVVDDDPDHADLLAEFVTMSEHQPVIARCATDALSLVETNVFDLILVDLGLPDFHGDLLVRQLRERGITCRIVATTGFGGQHARDSSMRSGVDAFFLKPFPLAKIREELEQLVKRSEVS